MKADRLLLLTDVAGVKDADGAILTQLSAANVRELTADGVISGGMIPKTRTALDAIEGGVRAVVILDGRAPHAVLLELFTAHGAGTLIRGVTCPASPRSRRRPRPARGWRVLGAFHPGPDDDAPAGCGTLVLLGPDGPGFWTIFRASPEVGDGAPDPLDRWSERVIGALAARLGAAALFPFGGPPLAALHRLGAAQRRRPGTRRSGCSSTTPPGSSSPTAARWRCRRGSTCRRRRRGPATPAPRPASAPARSGR